MGANPVIVANKEYERTVILLLVSLTDTITNWGVQLKMFEYFCCKAIHENPLQDP